MAPLVRGLAADAEEGTDTMSDTPFFPQPLDAFLVGAAIIFFAQVARYRLVRVRGEGMEDWIALLGTLRTRDFSGPSSYALGVTLYVAASLGIYFLLCKVSPETLKGAFKLIGTPDETLKIIGAYQMPIYIAAIFLGASSAFGERVAAVVDTVTYFFQDRIDVPNRVMRCANRLSSALRRKANGDRDAVKAWLVVMKSEDWLRSVEEEVDVAFARDRLGKLVADYGGALDELSLIELTKLADKFIKVLVVAGARRSGFKGIAKIATHILADVLEVPGGFVDGGRSDLPFLLAGLMLFTMLSFVSFNILYGLDVPVGAAFGSDIAKDGWPSDSGFLSTQLTMMVVPALLTVAIAATWWRRDAVAPPAAGGTVSLLDAERNLPRYAVPLMIGLAVNFVLAWIVQLYGIAKFGSLTPFSLEYVAARSGLYLVQALVPLGAGYATLVCLDFRAVHGRKMPLVPLVGFCAASAAAIAALSSATVLVTLRAPNIGPEFLLFSMIGNGLVAVSLVLSLYVFLPARAEAGEPAAAVPAHG